MKRLLKRLGLLLLLCPAFALANPTSVRAVAEGTVKPDLVWLSLLTGGPPAPPGAPLPFTLSIEGEFDRDSPGFSEMPTGWRHTEQTGLPNRMVLTVGDRTFDIANTGRIRLGSAEGFFNVTFIFQQDNGHTLRGEMMFHKTTWEWMGQPLMPRELSSGGNIVPYVQFYSYRVGDDASFMVDNASSVSWATVSVTSAIPEPNRAVMLLGGLALVLLAGRRPGWRTGRAGL